LSSSDIDGALALMTDDVSWRIPGKKESLPVAGVYNKEQIARLIRRMLEGLTAGLQMTVTSSTCEGDRVSLEVNSRGDLKNGCAYRQEYHFFLEFRDGKIAVVREYLDTQHVHNVWIAGR
jgi:ketosteroid isomerase-like protein